MQFLFDLLAQEKWERILSGNVLIELFSWYSIHLTNNAFFPDPFGPVIISGVFQLAF